MPDAKKILIETESHEIYIFRVYGKSGIRGFCSECLAETEMLTLDEAVSLSSITALEILGSVRDGKIHSLETASGHLLICQTSISDFTDFTEGEAL